MCKAKSLTKVSKMKGWKICKESEGERIWGGIKHEILNAAAAIGLQLQQMDWRTAQA